MQVILFCRVLLFLVSFSVVSIVTSAEPFTNIRNASFNGLETHEDHAIRSRRLGNEVNMEPCIELPQPFNTKQKWIIGENAMNGLSNQLFGIYSYVPVAQLWNVSLILGDVYSRDSFENAMSKYEGWNSLPFSSFFDFPHFQEFWANRGLAVIEQDQFRRSCAASSFKTLTIERMPHFWPNKDLVMNKMLDLSHIPLPIPDRSVLQFDALRPKFTAIYNYWKGGMKNKLLLLQVHRSVRPAAPIRLLVEALLQELPSKFLVAHVRLEGDFLLHEEASFEVELEAALSTINSHSCLKHLRRTPEGRLVDPPGIYVASGLFNATTYRLSGGGSGDAGRGTASKVPLSVQDSRAAVVIRRLQDLGFSRIYTREGLLGAVIDRISAASRGVGDVDAGTSSNTSAGGETGAKLSAAELAQLAHHIHALVPEQAALVDLTVSRRCQCFLSAHYSSSFSYMAQRLRVLDRGQVLRYPEISEGNFGKSGYFKQWGF